jgi:hypothetical protein
MPKPDVYISADIEADGPVPGRYSMLSFGLCVAATFDGTTFEAHDPTAQTFYAEMRPISEQFLPESLAVSGLDRAALVASGESPEVVMTRAGEWVRTVAGDHFPVLAAYPAGFDWVYLYWYFETYADRGSPFRFSSLIDMKTMYATKAGVTYSDVSKPRMPKHLLSTREHTHNALDDAIEQADLFVNLYRWRGPAA